MNAKKALKFSIRRILRNSPFLFNALPAEIRGQLIRIKFLNPSKGYGGRGNRNVNGMSARRTQRPPLQVPGHARPQLLLLPLQAPQPDQRRCRQVRPHQAPRPRGPRRHSDSHLADFRRHDQRPHRWPARGPASLGLVDCLAACQAKLPRNRLGFGGIDDPIPGRRRACPQAPHLQRTRHLRGLQIRQPPIDARYSYAYTAGNLGSLRSSLSGTR